ncbi:MAG: hypothetical protein IJC16_03545 [Rikenellaceae bacterium]|nr:hypothetical protein [Rikenellaceae bacterium]
MKIAILIQVHKNPEQVGRLCRALGHPCADLYLSIDGKCNPEPFRAAVPESVRWIERRTAVRWGDFSQVAATLQGLREIVDTGVEYDYVLFISGQDYPILPVGEIVRQIGERTGSEMIARIELRPEHPLSRRYRYRHYHFARPAVTHAVNRLIRTLSPARRSYPLYPVYKGSPWWCLSGACIRYVLDYCDRNPGFVRFNRTVHCPDELFFQTIIMHSPFAERVTGDNFRYIDWSAGLANPKTLGAEDYEAIVASGKWFARKLDETADSRLLDLLDAYRRSEAE